MITEYPTPGMSVDAHGTGQTVKRDRNTASWTWFISAVAPPGHHGVQDGREISRFHGQIRRTFQKG
jgi:hypothetical protein